MNNKDKINTEELNEIIENIKKEKDIKYLLGNDNDFIEKKSLILHKKKHIYTKRYRDNTSGRMAKCWCGSGLNKKDCHFKKFKIPEPIKKQKSDIMRSLDSVEICLRPNDTACSNIINAHSIQKKGILYLLSDESNHVYRINSLGDIKKEGYVSKASLFRGMCLEHDRVFNIFENDKFTATEKEIFMTHYRANVFELYRKICVYNMLRRRFIFLEDSNISEIDRIKEKIQNSEHKILNKIELVDFHKDYLHLRELYKEEKWGDLPHYIFYIKGSPLIAATGSFIPYYSPDGKFEIQKSKPNDLNKISITTHHHDNGFIIVLSSLKNNETFKNFIKLMPKSHDELSQVIFKVILEEMENVYLPKEWLDSLGKGDMDYIKELASTFSNYTRTNVMKFLPNLNWEIYNIKTNMEF